MTGLPGLPALDRALLPKPCRDPWLDSALEMGAGRKLFMGRGPWVYIWGKGIPAGWGRSQQSLHILWLGQRRESAFVTW